MSVYLAQYSTIDALSTRNGTFLPRYLEPSFSASNTIRNYPVTMSVNDSGEGLALVGQALEPHSPELLCDYMLQALTSLVAALDKTPYTAVGELEVVPRSKRCRQGR